MEQHAVPLLLMLLTPCWGNVRFQVLFVILPGAGDSIILLQMTLREVLCITVMADLRRMVTGMRREKR